MAFGVIGTHVYADSRVNRVTGIFPVSTAIVNSNGADA